MVNEVYFYFKFLFFFTKADCCGEFFLFKPDLKSYHLQVIGGLLKSIETVTELDIPDVIFTSISEASVWLPIRIGVVNCSVLEKIKQTI